MSTLTLLGRQSSHYTRQVRLLAHELAVPHTLVPIHDLLSAAPATYGGNPALKLPALRDGDSVVWGSANACRWLVRRMPDAVDRVFLPEQARDPVCMNCLLYTSRCV